MIDVRSDSIIYQAQVYFSDLVDSLVDNKRLGKALDKDWEKADAIIGYLDAYTQLPKLQDEDDITNTNFILECLVNLCELNQYPVASPLTFGDPPDILFGLPGTKGDKGDTGEKGDTGLATDFQVTFTAIPTIVDSFDITDSNAARWDYLLTNTTLGVSRAGTIVGHWNNDGSLYDMYDNSDSDTGTGSTSGLEFDLQFLGGEIRLVAVISSDSWTVVGSRYLIPNNGNGAGPISDVLPNGQVYIGNTANLAQARSVSGDITITNTGVTSISAGVIVNDDINTAAAISLNKLAPLTINRLLVSDGAGIISVPAANVQVGGFKITGVTPGAAPGEVVTFEQLVVGGPPTGPAGGNLSGTYPNPSVVWSDGYPTYDARYIRNTSLTPILTKVVDIGPWNMNSTLSVTVNHGLSSGTKILDIRSMVRSDTAGVYYPLDTVDGAGVISGGILSYDDTVITLIRNGTPGGTFLLPQFTSVAFSRGRVYITYEA